MMREERGLSQILYTFLPGQTADLNGRVWRVKQWKDARPIPVDQTALRQALRVAVAPWGGNDGGLGTALDSRQEIEVVQVDETRGVEVYPYPRQFRCRDCGRIRTTPEGSCASCSSKDHSQLHFVAFHECGRLEEPGIPTCYAHNASAMKLPGTTRTTEITFHCPVCQKHLAQGFLNSSCECGVTGKPSEALSINVHRASIVYTPRFATLVNSPDANLNAQLRASGGARRALDWFATGMEEPQPSQKAKTPASVRAQMQAMGASDGIIESMVAQMIELGELQPDADGGASGDAHDSSSQAGEQALSLASASVAPGGRDARVKSRGLDAGTSGPLRRLYEVEYPSALSAAGLHEVTLLEDFPVASVAFGYTRGAPRPGASRLRPYKDLGKFRCYGMLTRTEALLFELDPFRVLDWLRGRHPELGGAAASVEEARRRLAAVQTPELFDDDLDPAPGRDLLELVHSYSHRVVRSLTTFAGTDRDALAEYLLPNLAGFVVYGTGGGTFDLGGLRAVMETSLDRFLRTAVETDPRCPLDPGCAQETAACMACLHLGERSCARFNSSLSRRVLTGPGAYLETTAGTEQPADIPDADLLDPGALALLREVVGAGADIPEVGVEVGPSRVPVEAVWQDAGVALIDDQSPALDELRSLGFVVHRLGSVTSAELLETLGVGEHGRA